MHRLIPIPLIFILFLTIPGCSKSRENDSSASGSTSTARLIPAVMDVQPREDSAPSFAWTDTAGKRTTFEEFRGTLTVVNFWATWCGPCKKEMPDLVELSKELAPQGVTFLGISTDRGPDAGEKVSEFIANYRIPYLIIMSNEDLEEAFGNITGLPTTILVGQKGEIRKTIIGARSKAQFLEAINASLAPNPS